MSRLQIFASSSATYKRYDSNIQTAQENPRTRPCQLIGSVFTNASCFSIPASPASRYSIFESRVGFLRGRDGSAKQAA